MKKKIQRHLKQLLDSAVDHHKSGRFEQAKSVYQELLQESPKHLQALSNLAALYHQQGHLEEAANSYQKVLRDHPHNGDILGNLSFCFHQMGKSDAAIEQGRKAVQSSPNQANAHNNLGVALLSNYQLEEAEHSFKTAIRIQPKHKDAKLNLASVVGKLGKLEEAIDIYCIELKSDPSNTKILNSLANAYLRTGKLDQSENILQQINQLHPNQLGALRNLGSLYARQGKFRDAILHLKKAIEIDKHSEETHIVLGNTYQEISQLDKAAKNFQKTLTLNPKNKAAINNMGLLAKFIKNPKVEIARIKHRLSKHKPFQAAYYQDLIKLIEICYEANDNNIADYIDQLKAATQEFWEADYYLARIAMDKSNQVLAKQILAPYQRNDPPPFIRALQDECNNTLKLSTPSLRVGLHLNQPYHYGILEPVYKAYKTMGSCLITPHLRTLENFKPDVVVVAESTSSLLRARIPDAIYVHVRHGLISKNTANYSARISDYVCVAGESTKTWYENRNCRPRKDFWVTGYVQMDPLFKKISTKLPFDLSDAEKIILYAPTWNKELSSAPMLADKTIECIRGTNTQWAIIIKPHPVIGKHHPQWIKAWKNMSKNYPNVFLVEDRSADIMPILQHSDLLVSDSSSVIFEFLATNKPIVLITSPDRFKSAHFDATGIEWQWRDLAQEVFDVDLLFEAVENELSNPSHKEEKRLHYRKQLFGELTDGKAGKRIAENIANLTKN